MILKEIRLRDPHALVTGYFDYVSDPLLVKGTTYVSEMTVSPAFRLRYKDAYRADPQSKAANAFDIGNLLVKAYESSPAKVLSAAEAKAFLVTQKNVQGAVGDFSVGEDGNSSYKPTTKLAE